MLSKEAVLKAVADSGRLGEYNLLNKVDKLYDEYSVHPLNVVPKPVKLNTHRPNKDNAISIRNLLGAFYDVPEEEVCTLEIDGNNQPIDNKRYAMIRAILKLGITPNPEIAGAARAHFQHLLKCSFDYKSLTDIVKEAPKSTPQEKDIRKAMQELWDVYLQSPSTTKKE